MRKAKGRNQRSRQEVRRLVAEFRRSGLSKPAFAKSIGVHLSTVYNWVRRERAEGAGKRQRVIPVRIKDGIFPTESHTDLEIALGNGRIIRVKPGFDKESLASLVAILEERC